MGSTISDNRVVLGFTSSHVTRQMIWSFIFAALVKASKYQRQPRDLAQRVCEFWNSHQTARSFLTAKKCERLLAVLICIYIFY